MAFEDIIIAIVVLFEIEEFRHWFFWFWVIILFFFGWPKVYTIHKYYKDKK